MFFNHKLRTKIMNIEDQILELQSAVTHLTVKVDALAAPQVVQVDLTPVLAQLEAIKAMFVATPAVETPVAEPAPVEAPSA